MYTPKTAFIIRKCTDSAIIYSNRLGFWQKMQNVNNNSGRSCTFRSLPCAAAKVRHMRIRPSRRKVEQSRKMPTLRSAL
jgi:hypothetical protein